MNYKYIFRILGGILFLFSCSDDEIPKNLPPEDFSLVQILDNSIDVPLTPNFSWTRADDPEGKEITYSLLLEEGDGAPNNLIVNNITNTNYLLTEKLKVNTLYKWQVIATDVEGATTRSQIFSFTTRNNLPPTFFNLVEIQNGADNVSLKPKLSWESSTDPDNDIITYTVLFDLGNNTPTTKIAENLNNNFFEFTDELQYDTNYSWQVVAYDNSGNSLKSEIFSFNTRKFKEELVTSAAQFSTRTEHGVVEFNGRMWMIGGYHASNGGVNGGLLNDVWSSTDGTTWTEEVENNLNTSYTPRTNHTTVVFQNKIWVIGGGGTNSILNDIWSSSDGINWNLEISNAPFSKRYGHTTTVFNNKLWVIGGRDESSEYLNDIWSSSDGINWELVTNNGPFEKRGFHTSISFKNKLWVIAGYGDINGDLNDVWSSTDGLNWSLENISSSFEPRYGHSTVVYKDRIWVIAGNLKNDLWSSIDGVNWTLETETVNFSGRGEQASVVFQEKLWVIGGWMGSLLNDVWYFY